MTLYEQFQQKAAEIADLNGALSLLSWDQETNMPRAGGALRARQMATLSSIQHGLIVEDVMPLLKQLEQEDNLSKNQRLNVIQCLRSVTKQVRLPQQFVADLASKTSESQQVWEQAKRESNFKLFEKTLTELVALKRQQADYFGYDDCPYDALLDIYEPGMTSAEVSPLFNQMRVKIQGIVTSLQEKRIDNSFLHKRVPHNPQWDFSLKLLEELGYNFEAGRQDVSTHPFSIALGTTDVRITTRVDESNITSMLYSTIHECGHAMYEQGLPPTEYGLPGGEACSLSIHESQSRIWENNVARSLPFWEHIFKDVSILFPDKLEHKTPTDAFKAVNKVEKSFIRIEADEATYLFHIMLRYEIERNLINGDIEAAELPDIWNEKMKEYFGLTVTSDAQGVLQDIHWSLGLFGYFPTYALGSFYAAQFMHYAKQAIPDLDNQLKNGIFNGLRKWLAENIYRHGRLYNSNQLCKLATGKPLDVSYFLAYIQEKLEKVYSIKLQM